MKNNFIYFGIKTENRRAIFKSNYEQNKAEVKSNFRTIALGIIPNERTQFHQTAIDLLVKRIQEKFCP